MKKLMLLHKKSLIFICASLVLALLLQVMARGVSGFGEFYASEIFPVFPNTLGRFLSPVPFSVFEIGLYLIALLLVCSIAYFLLLLCSRKRRGKLKRLLPGGIVTLLCLLCTFFLMLTLTCGINYSRDGFVSDAGLITAPSSHESLVALTELLISDLNELAEEVAVDKEGRFSLGGISVIDEAKAAMERLGEQYPSLAGYYPNAKPVLLSSKMSDLNLTGIFSPFTVEANYNRDVCDYVIPYTICHELAHLKGYIKEDEAGFIGYLACSKSPSPELRYSAAVSALSYALNALYRDSTEEEYMEVLRKVPSQALYDLQCNSDYWKAHRGVISTVAQAANDCYLKANAQSDGVKSYGRMVDLLLAYYKIGASKV